MRPQVIADTSTGAYPFRARHWKHPTTSSSTQAWYSKQGQWQQWSKAGRTGTQAMHDITFITLIGIAG